MSSTNIKKSEQPKCRRFKKIVRSITEWREKQESTCRDHCCYPFIPLLACCCLNIKYLFIIALEPLILPIASLVGIITCFARLLQCHHGQDCLYSLLELFVVFEDCVGFYFDVAWWRKQKGQGVEDLRPVKEV